MMRSIIGHVFTFVAYVIFGLNIVMCKDISNADVLSPFALFFLRASGATILFWTCSMFIPHEHVSRHDLWQIVAASIIGLLIPQLVFLIGIRQTSSIDTSLITTLCPIFTMLFSAYFLGEPITWKKVLGVLLSFAGVVLLILNSLYHKGDGATQTTITGMLLLFVNCITFALYLGMFRPLIVRYHVVTFMKWMFLVTMLTSLPLCMSDSIRFAASALHVNARVLWEIAYVVVGATFLSYLLISIGQKYIRPTLVSMYSYLQPVVAVGVSIYIGLDRMTWEKGMAVAMIFTGVAIVTQSKKKTQASMIQIENVNHVAVICSDWKKSLSFYCDVLGFEVQDKTYREERDSWLIRLSIHGSYLLELFTFPNSPARLSYPEACGLRHLAFRVKNLEKTLHQLDLMNVPHETIRNTPEGEKCAFLHDPDGLPIELVETKA